MAWSTALPGGVHNLKCKELYMDAQEDKQKFISQIMTSKSPMRSCDDIDEQALSYAEIKALCAGDPRIREKMDLDVQVAKLKVLRGDFQNQKYRLEDKLLKTFPEEIQKQKTRIAALQQDSQIAAAHPQDKENFCGMTIKGMVYDDKKAAGERLLLARQEMPNADMMLLGTYRGFELNIRFDSFKNEHQAVLRAELSYPVSLGDDARAISLVWTMPSTTLRTVLQTPKMLCKIWSSRNRLQRLKWQSPSRRKKNWLKSLLALPN